MELGHTLVRSSSENACYSLEFAFPLLFRSADLAVALIWSNKGTVRFYVLDPVGILRVLSMSCIAVEPLRTGFIASKSALIFFPRRAASVVVSIFY